MSGLYVVIMLENSLMESFPKVMYPESRGFLLASSTMMLGYVCSFASANTVGATGGIVQYRYHYRQYMFQCIPQLVPLGTLRAFYSSSCTRYIRGTKTIHHFKLFKKSRCINLAHDKTVKVLICLSLSYTDPCARCFAIIFTGRSTRVDFFSDRVTCVASSLIACNSQMLVMIVNYLPLLSDQLQDAEATPLYIYAPRINVHRPHKLRLVHQPRCSSLQWEFELIFAPWGTLPGPIRELPLIMA